MRPFEQTIPLDDARAILDGAIAPIIRTETVALAHANGRVLTTNVVAGADVPPFSRAGMDGYAVRAADTAGATRNAPRTVTRVGRVFAGDALAGGAWEVGGGQCVEIATGAPMPPGADAVIMVEETFCQGDQVSLYASVTERQNVGRQGADIARGSTVMQAGDVLNASRVGALAALGMNRVEVYAKPRVAILSTGNEIVEPGTPLAPGQIYDINRYTLSALVEDHGGIADPRPPAGDTIDALSDAIDACLADDLIVFSGGSSVGERDLILDVLQAKGELLFHGLAVKPGKPTGFGVVGGKPFFGLPGYPTSCLSNGYILLVPALRRIARLPQALVRRVSGPIAQRVVSTVGRHQFYSVRVVDGLVVPAFKGSGDITSMSQADGYIEIATDVDAVAAGTIVQVTLF